MSWRKKVYININIYIFLSYAKLNSRASSTNGPLRTGEDISTDGSKMCEIRKKKVFSEPTVTFKINDPNDFFLNRSSPVLHMDDIISAAGLPEGH